MSLCLLSWQPALSIPQSHLHLTGLQWLNLIVTFGPCHHQEGFGIKAWDHYIYYSLLPAGALIQLFPVQQFSSLSHPHIQQPDASIFSIAIFFFLSFLQLPCLSYNSLWGLIPHVPRPIEFLWIFLPNPSLGSSEPPVISILPSELLEKSQNNESQ